MGVETLRSSSASDHRPAANTGRTKTLPQDHRTAATPRPGSGQDKAQRSRTRESHVLNKKPFGRERRSENSPDAKCLANEARSGGRSAQDDQAMAGIVRPSGSRTTRHRQYTTKPALHKRISPFSLGCSNVHSRQIQNQGSGCDTVYSITAPRNSIVPMLVASIDTRSMY